MTGANTNPFMFPGFGQSGEAAQNPMMASMEMMRQAWQNLSGAGAGAMGSAGMVAPPMSLEELDRRINEMRSVENWLRMNLSMLSSTIQGLEVQRATIATIKSFVSPESGTNPDAPSALEVALGLKPSGQAKIKPSGAAAPEANGTPSSFSSSTFSAPPRKAAASEPASPADSAAGVGNPDAWWGMLQQQFDTLAAATAASIKSAEGAMSAATDASAAASSKKAAPAKKAAAAKPAARAAKTAKTATSAPRKRAASPKKSS